MELPAGDPWVERGYGSGEIEPGERPAVLVVDDLASVRAEVPA
jgi:hypothetical protein